MFCVKQVLCFGSSDLVHVHTSGNLRLF